MDKSLSFHPALLKKYRFSPDDNEPGKVIYDLVSVLLRYSNSANGASEFGQDATRYSRVANAISELVSVRINDIENFREFRFNPFRMGMDSEPWMAFSGALSELSLDRDALRSLLFVIGFAVGGNLILRIESQDKLVALLGGDVFESISIDSLSISRYGNFSLAHVGGELVIERVV